MAITKLSITGNTTSVGISSTPVVISLAHKATTTSVSPDDNITATNVQAALEQLDDIKVQKNNGTLTNPTISGNASVSATLTANALNLGDTDLSIFKSGTWTPTNSDVTFTTQSAQYIRIGNLVIATLVLTDVDCSSVPNNSSYFCFDGLPYNAVTAMTGTLSSFVSSDYATEEVRSLATTTGKIDFIRVSSSHSMYNSNIDTEETDGSINATVIYFTS